MTEDVVDRAKAALEDVTDGPWVWNRETLAGGVGGYDEVITPGPVECMSYCYGGTSIIEFENPGADKAFIAAARTLVPELVREVEALRLQVQLAQGGVNVRPMTETESNLMTQVLTLRRELAAARSYRSLPPNMVWQDYASPDEVLKIRAPLDDEIERLRAAKEGN